MDVAGVLAVQQSNMLSGQPVHYMDQHLNPQAAFAMQSSNTHFQQQFNEFISSFTHENIRVYHQQIAAMANKRRYALSINLTDLKKADGHLYERYIGNPLEMLSVMEQALCAYLREKGAQFSEVPAGTKWQVIVRSQEKPTRLRDVSSEQANRLVVVNGIIISATKPFFRAATMKITCKNCSQTRVLEVGPGQNPVIPRMCAPGCPLDSFVVTPNSTTVDSQHLKIQENPEDIPVSETPRTYQLIVEGYNVGKCVPGDRVKITGIMLVHDLKTYDNLSKNRIFVSGIEKLKERSTITYTDREEDAFKELAKDQNIHTKIYNSIAPGIAGNQEIKKSIACMLFGASRKHLPDSTILRGDLNILLIGDPSTAKSQFLKFVEQAAPIAIYTSGKGSSAAGLTASITKDPTTNEFQIEGGALVLADGGIVCIDEFDKMKSGDRVAIHQAMQQQTISIAKAGITTRLNSRCSILAASNPTFGCYDDMKHISQQHSFESTILSRFDCIFIVRDINTKEHNNMVADKILQNHRGTTLHSESEQFSFDFLRKYIAYCRQHIQPRLSVNACKTLSKMYVDDRGEAKTTKRMTKSAMPITVRQLEAVIRISEAISRMHMRHDVLDKDVLEAHALFEASTMKFVKDNEEMGGMIGNVSTEEITKVEEAIKKRVCVGHQVATKKIIQELSLIYKHQLVERAIINMVRSDQLKEILGKKHLYRNF